MKRIFSLMALAALLAFGIVLANARAPKVDSSPRSIHVTSTQTAAAPAVTRVSEVAVFEDAPAWVRRSVGLPPLNRRIVYAVVQELDGYRTVLAKPKIERTFTVTADSAKANHCARADV